MDTQLATSKFQQAEKLFQEQDFGTALGILEELDQAYPNTKNILRPKAKCLVNLGRHAEAEAICDRLLAHEPDSVVQAIKDFIVSSRGGSDGVVNADTGIPGLDLSGLDDLLGPAPRKKEPRVPLQPQSDMPRNILIVVGAIVGIALVAGLGVMGAKKGWFTPVTADTVLTRLAEFWNNTKEAYSADMVFELTKAPVPIPLSVKGNGRIESMRKDGRDLSRLDMSVAISANGQSMGDMTMIVSSNGTDVFTEMHVMGQVMVMKAKDMGGSSKEVDISKIVEQIKNTFTPKLSKPEVLDGAKAYVLTFTPKDGQSIKLAIPNLPLEVAGIKGSFVQDNLSRCKIEGMDSSGGSIGVIEIKNVNASPGFGADHFDYKPPEGAKVMDMNEMQKMMPMMGGH